MSRKLAYILIAAMSLMIVIGIGISVVYYYQNKDAVHEDHDVTVTIGDQTTVDREFKLGKLNPGESTEYVIRLNSKKQSNYEVTLDFNEIADHGLKQLVDARITMGDTLIYEGSLEELLKDGKLLTFECAPAEDRSVALKVVYSMGVEVGNEAMGASADFSLSLSSKAK